jgi:glutathione S-transferase
MKLYFYPIAPNPTKFRLYLAEKAAAGTRIPITEVLVDFRTDEQNGPEHTARNYFQTVPVLELDDGTYLVESLVAMEYLEERYPTPPLIGRLPLERALVRQLERIAETRVLNPLARFIHATRSPRGLPPSPEIAEASRRVLAKGLAYFDALFADGRAFVAGAQPSIADCTLAAALNFGRVHGFERDPSLTHITRWETAYLARPPALALLGA